MIHKQLLDNLFKKQAEKGHKSLWVLHTYLGMRKDDTLSVADRQELMTKFKVFDSFLDKAIDKAKDYVDLSNRYGVETIYGNSYSKKFKTDIPTRQKMQIKLNN